MAKIDITKIFNKKRIPVVIIASVLVVALTITVIVLAAGPSNPVDINTGETGPAGTGTAEGTQPDTNTSNGANITTPPGNMEVGNKNKPIENGGKYTGYNYVVIAKDTPDEIKDELSSFEITPVMYVKGRVLVGISGIITYADLNDESKIYLCEGTYSAEFGGFVNVDGRISLTVTGDGKDKTVITAGTTLYSNDDAAFNFSAVSNRLIKNCVVENLKIENFEYGIRINYGENITVKNVVITQNGFAGVFLERAYKCNIENCEISLNGDPEGMDTGYGMSVLYDSNGNKITNTTYKNNANKNAIDFLKRGEIELPENNTVNMSMIYDIKRQDKPIKDPLEEAQNAKPTAKSIKFECEKGVVDGTGAVVSTSTEKVQKYSGTGWIFLFNTKITINVDVAVAGKYRLFIAGTSDDGNNKCDYVQINGGPKYLTSYLGKNKGQWTLSQPGTENWENNELHPIVQTGGFEFQKGKNVIEITANWGYCAYDYIVLEPIG